MESLILSLVTLSLVSLAVFIYHVLTKNYETYAEQMERVYRTSYDYRMDKVMRIKEGGA